MAKLTPKQQAFVAEYLVDLNGTQAAIRAGYSKKTAASIAQENLTKPEIQQAIQVDMKKREVRTEITQDRVVKELARIAFGDLRGAVTWGEGGVVLKNSNELTEDQAAAISEVSETTSKDGGSLRIKRHDKVKALELLGRHMGIFADKLEVSGKIDLTEVINNARQRANAGN